jgi:hypothetical protein
MSGGWDFWTGKAETKGSGQGDGLQLKLALRNFCRKSSPSILMTRHIS